ncbi:MAG: hypothetical protein MSH08_07030 [Ezakiella sp.]|nr:hypothetical protein [Ezakiella sp.]MDD7472081.1 hypothetical protein [Bacillota bacterium]MDY3924044.1 hypothetical protein [Ezakiella sp.]
MKSIYIVEGIKDVIKNKLSFVFLLSAIVAISIISVPFYNSLVDTKEEIDLTTKYCFEIVPLTTEKNRIKPQLVDFFQKYGNSEIVSQKFNEKYNVNSIILVGNIINDKNRSIIYAIPKVDSKKFNNEFGDESKKVEDFELNKKILKRLGLNQDKIENFDFYLSKSERLSNLQNLNLSESEIEQAISSLIIFKDNNSNQAVNELLGYSNENFDIVMKEYKTSASEELKFVIKYVMVYLIILLAFIILSFYIYNKTMYAKIKNSLIVNIYCGATLYGIYIRNSVFIDLVIILSWLILNYLNRFNVDIYFKVFTVCSIMFLIIFKIVAYVMIKKEFGKIVKWRVE